VSPTSRLDGRGGPDAADPAGPAGPPAQRAGRVAAVHHRGDVRAGRRGPVEQHGQLLVEQVGHGAVPGVGADHGLQPPVRLQRPQLRGQPAERAVPGEPQQRGVPGPGLAEVVAQGVDDRGPGRLAVVQLDGPQLAGAHPRAQVGRRRDGVVDTPVQGLGRAVVVDADQERVNGAHQVFPFSRSR
jgi:hypothetical protein